MRTDGLLCVQDRTFEDALSDAAEFWIRATLFELFPKLADFEKCRRPDRDAYSGLLDRAGFKSVHADVFAETRRRYASFDELRAEILARKGKSILFELTDTELTHYCAALEAKSRTHPLIEVDCWTVWLARNPSL